jgi:hypothetical protein
VPAADRWTASADWASRSRSRLEYVRTFVRIRLSPDRSDGKVRAHTSRGVARRDATRSTLIKPAAAQIAAELACLRDLETSGVLVPT